MSLVGAAAAVAGAGGDFFTCAICARQRSVSALATNDGCRHTTCLWCIIQWTRQGESTNSCPMCRHPITWIFNGDNTFYVPSRYVYLRVEVDGGRYVFATFPVRTHRKLLRSLELYQHWLSTQPNRIYEELQFEFRGVILNEDHKLTDFGINLDGRSLSSQCIKVILPIQFIFQYDGTRTGQFLCEFAGSTRSSLASFGVQFMEAYCTRVGSRSAVGFEYYMNGIKLSALGDYADTISYPHHKDTIVIVARERWYRLGS